MRKGRVLLASAVLLVGACYDQPIANGSYGSTTPRYERATQDNSLLGETVTPVRIGELGPSFAACNAQGEVRQAAADGPIPVRAAPYDRAQQTGQLPPGSRFFICSRSHDQRWLGVVYDQAGQANRACGVATPVSARRDYEGPCESGWAASAQVRLVSGVASPPGEPSQNKGQPK
jgi:hypothetical protein